MNTQYDDINPINLFPKIYLHTFMPTLHHKEPLIYSGMVREQGFKGLITDLATAYEFGLNEEYIVCSLNYPYDTLPLEVILDLATSEYLTYLNNISTIMVGLNKIDLQFRRLSNIRTFITKLRTDTKYKIFVSIDIDSLRNYDDISTILSILRPHNDVYPMLSGQLELNRIQSHIKNLLVNNLSYFSLQNCYTSQQLVDLLNRGIFDRIALSGKSAIKLIHKD